jgi:hypothetical protein
MLGQHPDIEVKAIDVRHESRLQGNEFLEQING